MTGLQDSLDPSQFQTKHLLAQIGLCTAITSIFGGVIRVELFTRFIIVDNPVI